MIAMIADTFYNLLKAAAGADGKISSRQEKNDVILSLRKYRDEYLNIKSHLDSKNRRGRNVGIYGDGGFEKRYESTYQKACNLDAIRKLLPKLKREHRINIFVSHLSQLIVWSENLRNDELTKLLNFFGKRRPFDNNNYSKNYNMKYIKCLGKGVSGSKDCNPFGNFIDIHSDNGIFAMVQFCHPHKATEVNSKSFCINYDIHGNVIKENKPKK